LTNSVNVTFPNLDIRVRLPLFSSHDLPPGTSSWHASQPAEVLTVKGAISACVARLKRVPDFEKMHQHMLSLGLEARLAWRRRMYLDWIHQETTVDGRPREWALLIGLAMAQEPFAPTDSLELRMNLQYPTTAITMPYEVLQEPAQCEGYVVRLLGRRRERLYFVTVTNHLFICPAEKAVLPRAPLQSISNDVDQAVLAEYSAQFGSPVSIDPRRRRANAYYNALPRTLELQQAEVVHAAREHADGQYPISPEEMLHRHATEEKDRILELLKGANGFIDLRDIMKIVFPKDGKSTGHQEDDDLYLDLSDSSIWEEDNSEPDLGTSRASRTATNFELHLRGDHVLRLQVRCSPCFPCEYHLRCIAQASSLEVAKEWSKRLRALTRFWRARLHEDARLQIQASNGFQRLHYSMHEPANLRKAKDAFDGDHASSSYLGLAYNWGKIDNWAGINTASRLYVKEKARARFKQRWVVLAQGHLFIYRHVYHPLPGQPILPVFYGAKGCIDLRNTYVISGALCSDLLNTRPSGYSAADVNGHRAPRVYRDGLMSGDEEEDCVLLLWKRPKGKPLSDSKHAESRFALFISKSC
jgi:hypothetical protein